MSDSTTSFERRRQDLDDKVLAEAALHVHATLEIAWLAAQSVFGDRATPDLALAVYDRVNHEVEVRAAQTTKTDADSSALSVEMGGFRVD